MKKKKDKQKSPDQIISPFNLKELRNYKTQISPVL